MVVGGLATGNAAQGLQALDFVTGDYSIKSVGEGAAAATANALGTEKHYREDKD
ncbi:MAG: hypothetical protein R6V35_04120 [Candidatus Nanohaloarchaea archaeon]